jgi:nitrate reductase gamma subunit
MDFLLWVRGPGFEIAIAIFVFGVIVRLMEIFLLGRRPEYSAPRASGMEGGWRTLWNRSLPHPEMVKSTMFTLITGYLFHLGLFITVFMFAPHIELFRAGFGISWPALPNALVDFAAILSMAALLAILARRLTHPLLRFLSGPGDYVAWTLTFLPLLTGFLAYKHLLSPYTTMLALHILSVEILLIALPFTKLTHTFTLFIARWYNGAEFARKGVDA